MPNAKIFKIARSLAFTICSLHLVTNYGIDVTLTKGPSMSPEIDQRGALVLFALPTLLAFTRRSEQPLYRKNDLVICTSPTDASKRICKRIAAVQGETVTHGTLAQGHVWLQGDNKDFSLDSRHYGPVSTQLIIGRVFAIFSAQGAKFV